MVFYFVIWGKDMLRDTLQKALTDAMKARDAEVTSALRLIIAKIKEKDVDIRGKGGKQAEDADICTLMYAMIKQRKDSIDMFTNANRPELVLKEQCEIDIINKYLPKQMDDAEVEAVIRDAIKETGAESMKDMGKVMGVLKEKYVGKMDMGKANGVIKNLLS